MDMLGQELTRLRRRMDELEKRVIPEFESKTQSLYAQILPLPKGSEEREKLETEYNLSSKELRLRCDEMTSIRREIERLERQEGARR